MQAEANQLSLTGFKCQEMRNAIPFGRDRETRASLACVGLDQMRADSAMRQLFLWQPLTQFVVAVPTLSLLAC